MTSALVAVLLGTARAQQEALYDQGPHTADRHHARTPEELEFADEQEGQYREELYSNANTIPGVAGSDYPTLDSIPRTSFSCADKLPGFYADEEAGCQVWHYCKTDGLKESFLCPNGTIYNQANRVCEWWFNVLCENTEAAFRVNEDLYIIPPSTAEPALPLQYQPQQEPQQGHLQEHQQGHLQEHQQAADYYAS